MTNTNSSILTSSLPRNYEVLRFWEDGSLLLGVSDLTGRIWTGTLCYFQNPEEKGVQYCNASKDVEFGVCDAVVLPGDDGATCGIYKAAVGYDCGGIEVVELNLDDGEPETPAFSNTAYSCEHDDAVISLGLLSDKRKFASGSYDRCIKIWDLESMTVCANYAGAHWNIILRIDCHPEESDLMASCGRDGRVLVWDVRLPRPASVLNINPDKVAAHTSSVPTSVAWQPRHGMKLAIGNEIGAVAVVDVRNPNGFYHQISTNERGIYGLEFAPWCDQQLAVCGDDTTVSVLNVLNNGLEVGYVDDSHGDFVHGLAWHPSSHKLYTCSWDQSIKSHSVGIALNGET